MIIIAFIKIKKDYFTHNESYYWAIIMSNINMFVRFLTPNIDINIVIKKSIRYCKRNIFDCIIGYV